MGIREKLNENPKITTAIAAGLIALTLIFLVFQLWPKSPGDISELKQFYTDDDGKTFFKDQMGKLTPFTGPNGREAVQAWVFRAGKGEPFVGYMEKYTDQGKKILEDIKNDKAHPERMRTERMQVENQEKLIKKPGSENKWINEFQFPQEAGKIKEVTGKDGNPAKMVSPGDL